MPPPQEIEFDLNEIEFSVDEIDGSPDKKNPAGAGDPRPTDIHGRPIPFGSEDGGASNRFVGALAQTFNPIEIAKGLGTAVAHPIDTAKGIYEGQVDTFSRGAQDVGQGRYSEGGAKMLAGLVPLVGPAAAKAGERIGSGDVAGGLGEGAGLVAGVLTPRLSSTGAAKHVTPYVTGKAQGLYGKLLNVPDALANSFGAENIVNTGLREGIVLGKQGVAKAKGLLDTSRAKAMGLVKSHVDTAPPVHAREVARGGGFGDVRRELQTRTLTGEKSQVPRVSERFRDMAEAVEGPRYPHSQDVTFKEVPRGAPGAGPSAGPRGSIGSVELPAPLSGSTTPGGWSAPTATRPPADLTAGSFSAGNIRNLVPVNRPGNLAPGSAPGTLGASVPPRPTGSFAPGNLKSPLIEPLPPPTGGPVPPGTSLWNERPGASFQLGEGSITPSPKVPLKAVPGKVNTRLTGEGIDVVKAQAAKEAAQDAAYGGNKMVKSGAQKQLSADDLLDQAVARGYKKAVEKRVPGVEAQNLTTQEMLGIFKAAEKAVKREGKRAPVGMRDLIATILGSTAGSVLGPVGAGVGGLTTAALLRALTSQKMGSRAAIGAYRAAPHIPKVAAAPVGLAPLLQSHDEE